MVAMVFYFLPSCDTWTCYFYENSDVNQFKMQCKNASLQYYNYVIKLRTSSFLSLWWKSTRAFTISELEALCSFITFSWTFPMTASAHRASEMRTTPSRRHKKKITSSFRCMNSNQDLWEIWAKKTAALKLHLLSRVLLSTSSCNRHVDDII